MSDAAALKAEANAAFAAKDFVKASELYSKAIDVDGSNHVLFSNRSASKASLKDFSGALEDAERCVELNPDFVKGYARKGAALHGLGRYEDAVFAYDKGLEKEPTNAALKSGLASVKSAMDSNPPFPSGPGAKSPFGDVFSDPSLLGKLATNPKTRNFMSDPAFVEKIKKMQRGDMGGDIGGMLQDPRMLTVLGVAMGVDMQAFERPEGSNDMPPGTKAFDSEDDKMQGVESTSTPAASGSKSRSATVEDDSEPTPSARPQAQAKKAPAPEPEPEAMEVEPTEDEINKKKALELKAKGTEAYKKKEFEGAVEAFKAAWETWKGDVTFLTNLAAVYFEQKEYDLCIKTCEEAVEEARPLRADYKIIAKTIARIGSAYERKGDLDQAVKYYGRSLTEHRTPDVLQKLRDAEKLKADTEKKAYINPELAEKAREEGNVQFKSGQFADAVKSYSEAIKRLPTDARGYNNRAAAYNKLAALPEALKDAEAAIKIDPKFVKAYLRKSTVLFGMREYTKALSACQEAADVDTEKKHTREIETQLMKCTNELYQQRQGETDEQTLERAMRDPEVAQIMGDPVMQSILQQSQRDPKALQDHMKNPMIRTKIQKLIAAGIIKTR